MSNVTLRIAGRTYRLGCAEGQERHIEKLGAAIDARLSAVPGMAGQSETHALLYAALFMADDLDELRKQQGATAVPPPSAPAPAPVAEIAAPLEKLAARLETLAGRLEDGRTSH